MFYKILALCRFQIKSLLKLKATHLLIVISLISIVFSFSLSSVNIATKNKLFFDLLLVSQNLLLHMAAIFYTFEFLNKERYAGLFVLPLSANISRFQYLFSIFVSLFAMVMFLFFAFIFLDFIILWGLDALNLYLFIQLLLYLLSSLLIISLIIMLSQYVSIMNSVIYSIVFIVIGLGLDELWVYTHYVDKDTTDTVKYLSEMIYYLWPNFSLFDHIDEVVNNSEIDIKNFFFVPVLYFVGILTLLFIISYKKFKVKVLKIGE